MKLKITSKDQIPGTTSQRQHRCYEVLGQRLNQSANVLEVGCGYGRSTWAWLDAMPANINFYVLDAFVLPQLYNPSDSRFYEIHRAQQLNASRSYLKKYFNADQQTVFNNIVSQHPKYNLIKEVFDSTFQEWKKTNNIKFDLVYLDGDHAYEEVSSQLEYFCNSTYICGDDYLWPSVGKAVNEFVQENKFQLKTTGEFFTIYT